MKRSTSGLLIAAFLAVLPSAGLEAGGGLNPYTGMDGMPLMQIELNSRVNGLAGAFCAAADDASALSVNPGGLARLNRFQAQFVHFDWLADTSLQSLTWAQPIASLKGVMAFNAVWLSVPEFVNYDRYGYEDGTIAFRNMVLSAAYARRIASWSLGAQLRYGFFSIPGRYTRGSLGLDLGGQTEIPEVRIPLGRDRRWIIRPLTIGVSLLNIATPAGQDSVAWKLKTGIKVPVTDSFFFTLDLNKPIFSPASLINADWRLNAGGEFVLRNILFLRAGVRLGYDLNFATIGAGVRYQFGLLDASVDYVHLPYRHFGPINNFSVDTKFESLKTSPTLTGNRQKLLEQLYFHGLSLYSQNKFDEAIAEWNKALELDPENKVILKAIREALIWQERLKQIEERKRDLSPDPSDDSP